MRQLIHNGVLIPKYRWKRLRVSIRGVEVELTPEQEEMVVAWVRKLGTGYVEDKVFVKNFFEDFCKSLGVKEKLGSKDFDFSVIEGHVERERALKIRLSKEEKKRLREERKALREANKKKYGYAIVDGVKTEVSNYTAEPSCIFMGRGKHPLRGRWKEGPRNENVELNLSPDAPRPLGNWKIILWQPDVMWVARWRDKLTGRMRYVWLSENSTLKQRKDVEKFDKAQELQRNLARIREHIWENLDADDLRRRKTATVCFLINRLKIRVGDEKDPDEADTVGASTLRPKHIQFEENGNVTFNFLGKDSVPYIFEVHLPEKIVKNLKEFSVDVQSTLFDGVDSRRVSEFLDEVICGLSAKVFRTYYASRAVENGLESAPTKIEDPDYVKRYAATMANLEAAKVCNHRRKIPETWESSLEKREARLQERIRRAEEAVRKMRLKAEERKERYMDRLGKYEEKIKDMRESIEVLQQQLADRNSQGKSVASLKRRINGKRRTIARERERIKNLKAKHAEQMRKLKDRLENRRQRDKLMIEKMRLQIKTRKETRDYNLGTSLKSYIDPRIYYHWGKQVDYNWKLYYPKTLQKKFSWVETTQEEPEKND
ncbi:MAG: DNA topoisomerase I [Candidatus Bathyarchaeota archaeon]|nr:DNA topoisomerase I [Candidatus Bathyarchaeota archaeon]